MELPGLTHIGMERCQNLNWKGQFIDAEWDPTVQQPGPELLQTALSMEGGLKPARGFNPAAAYSV